MFWTIYSYIEKQYQKQDSRGVHLWYISAIYIWISNQKWPRFAPKLAVHRPKFWGKIARILVRRLLLRSGLRCKITVINLVSMWEYPWEYSCIHTSTKFSYRYHGTSTGTRVAKFTVVSTCRHGSWNLVRSTRTVRRTRVTCISDSGPLGPHRIGHKAARKWFAGPT